MNQPAQKERTGFGAIAAIAILVGYLGFEVSILHTQKYRTEPLYVHNEFVTANQATLRCGDPGAEERQRFQSNFQVVRRQALKQLQETDPQAAEQELSRQLDTLATGRIDEVNRFIDANGCGHKDVWRWVKLHEVRARLSLK